MPFTLPQSTVTHISKIKNIQAINVQPSGSYFQLSSAQDVSYITTVVAGYVQNFNIYIFILNFFG